MAKSLKEVLNNLPEDEKKIIQEEIDSLKSKINSKKFEKESDHQKNDSDTKVLESFSLGLEKLESIEEIYQFAAKKIYSVCNESVIVTIADFHTSKNTWEMKVVEGLNPYLDKVTSLLGFDLRKMKGKINANTLTNLSEGKLNKLDFNLEEMTYGLITQTVWDKLSNLISINDLYSILVNRGEELLGNISIVTTTKTKDINQNLLEHLIRLVNIHLTKTTAIKRADGAQSEKEKILISSLSGTYIFNIKENQYTYINPTHTQITGWSLEELKSIGDEFISLFHPEDFPRLSEHMAKLITSSEDISQNIEYRYRSKNGNWIWILSHDGIYERNNQGEVESIIGSFLDITERKKNENLLAESESKLKYIVNNAPGIAYQFKIDKDGNPSLPFINENCYNLYGYTADELMQNPKTFIDSVYKDDKEVFEKNVEESRKNLSSFQMILRIVSKSGKVIWLDARSTPQKMEEGSTLWTGIGIDISKRIKVKESLKKSEDLLNEIGALAKIGGWEYNIISQELYWTKTTRELHEVPEDYKPIVETAIDFYVDEYRELIQKALTEAIEKGKPFDLELKIKTAKGKIFWARALGQPNYINGNIVSLNGTFQDISQQKIAEKELKVQSQILENMAEGAFLVKADDLKIIYTNPEFDEMFGYENGELIGKEVSIVNAPNENDPKEKVQEIINELNKKGFWRGEVHNIKKDGTEFFCFANVSEFQHPEYGKVWVSVHTDITERKLIEKKLNESDRIFNHSLDMLCIAGFDGYFKVLNPSWERTLGWSTEELLSNPWNDYVHPEDLEKTVNIKSNIVNGQEVYQFINRYICKDGSIKWLSWNSFPYPEENVMIGVARDITESIKFEEELKRTKDLYQNLAESVNVISSEFDIINNRWNYVSPQSEVILGYKQEEWKNFEWWRDHIYEKDRDRSVNFCQSETAKGKHHSFEYRFIKSDGSLVWVNYIANVEMKDETPVLLRGVFIDITKNKKYEEEIKASEEKYRTLFEQASDGILIGNLEGIIINSNESISRITGYPKEEILGRRIDFLFEEKELQRTPFDYDNVLAGKAVLNERILLRKDGHKIYVEMNSQKVGSNRLQSYVRNISDKKNAEKAIIENQRLGAIGEMSSAIAHDFNNSLQAIYGNLEIALLNKDIPHEVFKYLNTIKTSVNDASTRVKMLQRFGGNKVADSNFVHININQILEDVINQTRPLWKDAAEKNGINISIEKNFIDSPLVLGNEGELRAVIYNIIKNSIEAMPKGGKISIVSKANEGNLQIKILDTGIGMNSEIKSRIFQPFFTTKGFEAGRGLGMSGAYSIIKEHGGELAVLESNRESGTTMGVLLPISKREEPKKEMSHSHKLGKALKILWVDDDQLIRDIVIDILDALGHEGEIASSGEKALEILENKKFDLIITDIGMPGMNGWELAEKINSKFNSKIKIVVSTGWGDQITPQEKQKYGIFSILSKPFKVDQLTKLIGEVNASKN